ncbi:MAG: YraN family protein [Lachnospiraceae bacterium]|nr:YraN family protein [Lachnospiraceae bacterium]MBQ4069023.1 YraN family protein [Lachnospiraceae bacterium]
MGTEYEKRACKFLEEQGYIILETNYRCKYGEIDIIAKDINDGYISFIEVKYRAKINFGLPYEAVDYRKQNKIIKVSKNYIKDNNLLFYSKYRYDVVSIYDNEYEIIKNAFGGF